MDPEALDALVHESSADGEHAGRVHHGGARDTRRLDFSANVNPRRPTGTASVYESAFGASCRYPADDYPAYRAAAADHVGCAAREIFPTHGGMGALRLAVETTVQPGDRALVPAPSFGEYAREVKRQGGSVEYVGAAEILAADPGPFEIAFVCQPNNPTGQAFSPGHLREFADRCRSAGTVLVVDEAFLDFTRFDSLAGRPGVVVLRSLTKIFGLPGLRMGFAVATGGLRDRLGVARQPWSLSVPAAAVGEHCLGDEDFVAETRERVAEERERIRRRLGSRFDVAESRAPFLLLESDDPAAVDRTLETARAAGLALRDARTFRGLDRHIRVAVRLPHENDRLLDALDV
jgi:histidinol-phosphate aminotransferase/threonine-phosphate decarboxylase